MLEFLKSWILQHILQTDRTMAGEVHEKMGTEAPHNMFTHF
jgi:hemerythrin